MLNQMKTFAFILLYNDHHVCIFSDMLTGQTSYRVINDVSLCIFDTKILSCLCMIDDAIGKTTKEQGNTEFSGIFGRQCV